MTEEKKYWCLKVEKCGGKWTAEAFPVGGPSGDRVGVALVKCDASGQAPFDPVVEQANHSRKPKAAN